MIRFIRNNAFAMVIILWVIAGLNAVFAQKEVTMYLIDRGWNGDTNYIELRANQFQDISSLHFSIQEKNHQGSFYAIDQIVLPMFQANSNFVYSLSSLDINWTSPIIDGFNIPDGQLLFRIKWKGNPSSNPCYEIFNNATIIKVKDNIYDTTSIIAHQSCDSYVSIPSFFNAFWDQNANCTFDNKEILFSTYTIQDSFNQNILIYKHPEFLVYSKSAYGRHYFKIIPESPLWSSCNLIQTLDIDSTTKLISLSYGIQAIINCPQLDLEIHSSTVRRCVDYSYNISYQNIGTLAEDSAKIIIKLDPYMSLKSASIPISNLNLPFVEFNIGKLDVFQTGTFTITVNIDCATTVVGQTHCITSQILPNHNCIVSPLWSGATIKLDAKCDSGKVKFRIANAGSQNMLDPIQYWIVEDDILPGLKKDVKLNAGQFLDLEYPANGKCYRMFADQVKNHPGHSNPTIALEACGRDNSGNFSTGYWLMFAEDEEDSDIAVDCQASRASLDPNDKIGTPIGYDAKHYIEPGRSLEYKIRFKNTGNDTAFKVIIVDTLSEWLDLKTFKVLGASHEFSFSLVDRVLSFRFDPIYLPYQSIDDTGSGGFVIFSIKPKDETPLNTVIENNANIIFDSNAPIQTNTTFHTLATDFIVVAVVPADPENTNANIYPNPGTDYLMIQSDKMSVEKELVIYDSFGRVALSQRLNGKVCKVSLHNSLIPGVYFLHLKDSRNHSYRCKVIIDTKK